MALPNRDGAAGLIGGLYAVDATRPLPAASPPLLAYEATRAGQAGYVAVAVERGCPARARALSALAGVAAPNLMLPLAHGAAPAPNGGTGYYVICPAPPGRSLAANPRNWSEAELLDHLLKPVAGVLAKLQSRSVTHRAIRADNVFQAGPGMPVMLGCAWGAPPGCHQPAWLEPPSSAACLPAGRGDGAIADDVYALGALMMALALRLDPARGVADPDLLRRKLDMGSFAALIGNRRLPGTLADLLRGMLADDPEHRPSPALLANPVAARSRRVAARPPRRAQRPLAVGPQQAWTARMLAHELAGDPSAGLALLRDGSVGRWVHRALGDSVAAGQIEGAIQQREADAVTASDHADALLMCRTIALLDPAAPLTWRSVTLWPDGLGPALDHALRHKPEQAATLAEIATAKVPVAWEERRSGSRESPGARADAPGWPAMVQARASPLRLSYALNPLAPCESSATGQAWVTRLAEILPALEADAGRPQRPDDLLVAAGVAAFIEARRDERIDSDLGRLAASWSPSDVMSQLRLVARLQTKTDAGALPRLSVRAVALVQPLLARFSSRSRRERLAAQLAGIAEAGRLAPIVALLDSGLERDNDDDGLVAARARLASIETLLTGLEASSADRLAQSHRLGEEVADGLGLVACLVSLALAVFG